MISPCTKTLLLWSYDAAISPESAKKGVPQVLAEQKHLYSALMVPLQISKLPILCAPMLTFELCTNNVGCSSLYPGGHDFPIIFKRNKTFLMARTRGQFSSLHKS